MEKKNPHLQALQKRVAKAPEDPGVYRWKDTSGTVLYIGKAKNLRKRLQSYTSEREGQQGPWKRSLVNQIADFDVTVTRTELEALIMETNWIKEQKPKYNVMMKDDKSYVYVCITVTDTYPTVSVVRRMENDGAKYFGPYLQAWGIKKTLDMLDDLYRFRACKKSLEELNRNPKMSLDSGHPCLEYQIGKCNGLCVGDVSEKQYRERIEEVMRFLRGDRKSVLEHLRDAMALAAQEKKFERAASLRDTLQYVESLEEEQFVSDTSGANTDAIGIALSGPKAQVVVLRERSGKLIDERSFALSGEAESAVQVLEQFIPQYYASETDIPDTLLISEDIAERELLEAYLTGLKEKKVTIHIPERGKKTRLLEMAETNAGEKIRQQLARFEAAARSTEEALKELQTFLNLLELPKRIEGYDISHLGGTETVGSMVVMKNGKPVNDQYRSFTVRTVIEGEIDDYKAMREVLRRRLLHLKRDIKAEEKEWKEKGISVSKVLKKDTAWIEEHLKETAPDTSGFLLAKREKEIIGCTALRDLGKAKELTHLWTQEDDQNLALFLIQKLLSTVKKGKVYTVTNATHLSAYMDLGFRHIHDAPEEIMKQIKNEDSVAMMYDTLQNKRDVSLSATPDLLVIDGGKGQLGVVVEVLAELGMTIPVIGLAKQEEEVFVPGEKVSRFFPKESQGKYLLMRLRDEAHRFANRHREARKKNTDTRSALDDVPGIGDTLKQKLLQKFGTVSGVRAATDDELLVIVNTAQLAALRNSLR